MHRDRRDVADEIEIELVVKRRVDRVRGADQKKRVAVRGRPHDRLGGDIAAGSRPVLNDEWLAEPLRQPLTHQARDDVGRAAGAKPTIDAHRPRRIGLRPRDARHGRQRGSARGQMQKLLRWGSFMALFHLYIGRLDGCSPFCDLTHDKVLQIFR